MKNRYSFPEDNCFFTRIDIYLWLNQKTGEIMSKATKILISAFLFLLIALFTGTGCASAKKQASYINKKNQALCDLSHLGRNKYYYSKYYQNKLARSVKRISSK